MSLQFYEVYLESARVKPLVSLHLPSIFKSYNGTKPTFCAYLGAYRTVDEAESFAKSLGCHKGVHTIVRQRTLSLV